MPTKHSKLATALGAKLIAKVPSTGPGAFGAARLQHLVANCVSRLQPSSGERSGRPTESN